MEEPAPRVICDEVEFHVTHVRWDKAGVLDRTARLEKVPVQVRRVKHR